MTDQTKTVDWYDAGCARDCTEQHTYTWGRCALASESARPEPTVSMSVVYDAADGHKAIGFDKYTVPQLAELIEPALRTIKIRLGPNARSMLERGDEVRLTAGEYASLALAAADAIVHRNDKPEPEQPARTTVKNPDCSPDAEETEPNNPAATTPPSVRTRIARAIHRYDNHHGLSGNDIPSGHHHGEADAVLTELERELAALAEYENAITWHTDCLSCARVLDSGYGETVRAEKAEDTLALIGERCDMADVLNKPITTDDVRVWLRGTRCAREAAGEQAAVNNPPREQP